MTGAPTTQPGGALGAYFAAMGAMLVGRTSAVDVETACGPSPSGTARLQYYRTLVSNDWTGLLDAVFAYARRQVEPAAWTRLCHGYLDAHPPAHWELNRLGAGLPAWIAGRLEAGDGLPPWLAELADVEWLELEVYLSPAEDRAPWVEGPVAINPTVDVRQLRWDVPRWISAGRLAGGPEERAVVTIAWRDPRSLKCRFAEGTPDTLFVIQAVHQGLDPGAAAAAHGLDPAVIGALMRDLGERGLLVADRTSSPRAGDGEGEGEGT